MPPSAGGSEDSFLCKIVTVDAVAEGAITSGNGPVRVTSVPGDGGAELSGVNCL